MASGQGATLTNTDTAWTIELDMVGAGGDHERAVLERMPLSGTDVVQEADGHVNWGGLDFEGDPETVSGEPPMLSPAENWEVQGPIRPGFSDGAKMAGMAQLVTFNWGEWRGGENPVATGRLIWKTKPSYTPPTPSP